MTQRNDWDLDLFIEAIPFDETRKYTQRVLGRWLAYRWLYGTGDPKDRVPHLPLRL
jgi:soluble lytic murein transglycosylase